MILTFRCSLSPRCARLWELGGISVPDSIVAQLDEDLIRAGGLHGDVTAHVDPCIRTRVLKDSRLLGLRDCCSS